MIWIWWREDTEAHVVSQKVLWYLVFSIYPQPSEVFSFIKGYSSFLQKGINGYMLITELWRKAGKHEPSKHRRAERKKNTQSNSYLKKKTNNKAEQTKQNKKNNNTILIHYHDSWQTGRTDIRISFFSSLRLLKIQAGERYVIFIKDGCGMILSF